MRTDITSYCYWSLQALGRNILASSLESIVRRFHLDFLKFVQPDYTMSVFRSRLSFLFSTYSLDLIVDSILGHQVSVICMLEMYFSDRRKILCGNFQCFGELSTTHPKILLFTSNIRLVSLSKASKKFSFNSNLCRCLLSSKLLYISKKHRWALSAVIVWFCVR